MAVKLKENRIEGGVIVVLGLLMLAGTFTIPDNPVKIEGWIDFVAEARFVPFVMAVALTCLGIAMFPVGKGAAPSEIELHFAIPRRDSTLARATVIIAIHVGYLVLIGSGITFLVSTFAYLIFFIAYTTYKEIGPLKILLATLVSTFTVAYLLPLVLEIMIP